jgi:hypothetical protein
MVVVRSCRCAPRRDRIPHYRETTALAGQQTVSNLLGSGPIMLEKPFRFGNCFKVGGIERTVDDVGSPRTRNRTLYDSLDSTLSSSAG